MKNLSTLKYKNHVETRADLCAFVTLNDVEIWFWLIGGWNHFKTEMFPLQIRILSVDKYNNFHRHTVYVIATWIAWLHSPRGFLFNSYLRVVVIYESVCKQCFFMFSQTALCDVALCRSRDRSPYANFISELVLCLKFPHNNFTPNTFLYLQ